MFMTQKKKYTTEWSIKNFNLPMEQLKFRRDSAERRSYGIEFHL